MKPNELQFKQFGKPRGKTVMQIVGSKLLLTTASSNISPSVQQWLKAENGGGIIIIIIKEVMRF